MTLSDDIDRISKIASEARRASDRVATQAQDSRALAMGLEAVTGAILLLVKTLAGGEVCAEHHGGASTDDTDPTPPHGTVRPSPFGNDEGYDGTVLT